MLHSVSGGPGISFSPGPPFAEEKAEAQRGEGVSSGGGQVPAQIQLISFGRLLGDAHSQAINGPENS